MSKTSLSYFLFKEKNTNLSDSIRQLSNNFGQLQAKEQELLTKLKLKVKYKYKIIYTVAFYLLVMKTIFYK